MAKVIYEAESQVEYVYFPETSVVSLLSTLEKGATTEVGLSGREGMVRRLCANEGGGVSFLPEKST